MLPLCYPYVTLIYPYLLLNYYLLTTTLNLNTKYKIQKIQNTKIQNTIHLHLGDIGHCSKKIQIIKFSWNNRHIGVKCKLLYFCILYFIKIYITLSWNNDYMGVECELMYFCILYFLINLSFTFSFPFYHFFHVLFSMSFWLYAILTIASFVHHNFILMFLFI